MKKNVKNNRIKKGIRMVGRQQERPTFFEHRPVIDDDLSAKDLHGKPDKYFKHPVKQTLKFFVNISNAINFNKSFVEEKTTGKSETQKLDPYSNHKNIKISKL